MTIHSEGNDVVVVDDQLVSRTLCVCPDYGVAEELSNIIAVVGLEWIVPSINKLPAR